MKKFKKLTAIILTIASLFTSTAFAGVVDYGTEYENQPSTEYKQKFTDVLKSHWAFGYIAEMEERGVISGYPDGKYYPDKKVTRAEFARIMTSAAGLTLSSAYESNYADVNSDDWFAPYVNTAKYYLSGYKGADGLSYYLPNDSALREDIAVALVLLKGYDTTGYDLSILQTMFSDWQSISDGAQKYVAVAIEKELISGYDDGTFKGQSGISRAEAATLLWRAYQYGNGNKEYSHDQTYVKEEIPEPTATPKPTEKEEDKTVTVDKPTVTEKPEPTKEPEKPKNYDYSLKLSAKELDLELNEETDGIEVMISDENPDGIDLNDIAISGGCLAEIDEDSIYGGGDAVRVHVDVDTSKEGTFSCSFNYKDKTAICKVNIVDNTPKYEWKVTTIRSGVPQVDDMMAVPGGVLYVTGRKTKDPYLLHLVTDDGIDTVIFDEDEYNKTHKIQLESIGSKIGYNKYDNCYYIDARIVNGGDVVYNITKDEFVPDNLNDTSWHEERVIAGLSFDKHGLVWTNKVAKFSGSKLEAHSVTGLSMDDDGFFFYSQTEQIFGYYDKAKDSSYKIVDINEVEEVDEKGIIPNHFKTQDLNGMSDGKFGATKDSVYFHDQTYQCIRKIERQ